MRSKLTAVGLLAMWLCLPARAAEEKRVPLDFELPPALFTGTKKPIPLNDYMLAPPKEGERRKPFLAPEGTANVALRKPVTSSADPMVGELELVTDGDKRGTEGTEIELDEGRQWVQIDLGASYNVYAILLWHSHREGRYYHDVVVQTADDPDFIMNVRTVYNNDYDNSSGLGLGKEKEYFENCEGKLLDTGGIAARYVRLYSKGSTANGLNHYVEVEVWGRPAK